jgi:hypothetical protein
MSTVDAKDLAQTIMAQLGRDFSIPDVDLSDSEFSIPSDSGFDELPSKVSIDDLTKGVVDGDGAFDRLMTSNKAHLKEQYEKGRLTGDQYAKAYVELTTAMLTAAVQVVLTQDQSYWQARLLQMQGRRAEIDAITARIQLEIAKAELAQAQRQSELVNAQYVLTQMQISKEDAAYRLILRQIEHNQAETIMVETQKVALDKEIEINDYRLDNMMPQELANMTQQEQVLFAQERLLKEQSEAQRAQTMDVRTDGITPVVGAIGKQKDLYTQQIDSYRKDAEQKVAKMYLDGWITQKTLDEGLNAPPQLTNAEINEVLVHIRQTHDMGS